MIEILNAKEVRLIVKIAYIITVLSFLSNRLKILIVYLIVVKKTKKLLK